MVENFIAKKTTTKNNNSQFNLWIFRSVVVLVYYITICSKWTIHGPWVGEEISAYGKRMKSTHCMENPSFETMPARSTTQVLPHPGHESGRL